MEDFKPVLNLEQIQQKANEYAQKGAEEMLKEFYTGYDSPYKKAIKENLIGKGLDENFDIPDIVAVLNQKLSAEIDVIANTAIAKTFIPLVKEFLTREAVEVKFSQILEKFINCTDFEYSDIDVEDYTVNRVDREGRSSSLADTFPVYQITNGKEGFEIHFFRNGDTLTIMSLPQQLEASGKYYREYERKDKMRISLDGGATLELPFMRGILDNDFMRYCARLIIGNTNVILDVEDFNDEMFPERRCHC